MSQTSRAVFLSYASQDTEAARRICEALRSAGVEVWYDQSELRGGDVWDQKIRHQIRDCALFIPIISTNSQARSEGYFRLEWHMADQRTHLMARSRAFLVPVCIDDTRDAEAEVPESFTAVQWTRLPGGRTPATFVERIQRLLAASANETAATTRPTSGETAAAVAQRRDPVKTSRPFWKSSVALWVSVAAVGFTAVYLVAVRFVTPNNATHAPPLDARAGMALPAAIPGKSIAVLPFVDLSEKKDQEYFSDGLSEELIDLLTKVPNLRVPARTSSFFFKGKSDDIATIAQKLRVAYVLEGSVRKAGNTIRVTAQLIRADDGYHLWSETYDRALKDVFKVQDEISGAVVAALKLKLAPGQQASSAHRTSNTEAYSQYLLGRQIFGLMTPEGFRRATQAYRKSIELDSTYAAAYAGLAMAEFLSAVQTNDVAGIQRAVAAGDKAVMLAPDQADGFAARGLLRFSVAWDWTGAQADFEKALSLDPADSTIQWRYGALLAALGRLPEALAATRKAIELDPLSSPSWSNLGALLLDNRQFAAAEGAIQRALEIQPESVYARSALGYLQLLEGKSSEALATLRTAADSAGVAMAEHSLGHVKESQQALDLSIANEAKDAPYAIAEVYAWRGEKDKAFEWLDRAYQQRDNNIVFIKGDVLLAGLHGDVRFDAILRKMQLLP